MSKIYIPTSNVGKAHDADIYSVCMTNPYTITCGGDGQLKLWDNKVSETEGQTSISKVTPAVSHFVHASGLHHVNAFYSVETNDIGALLIIATVSFSGDIFFYRVLEDENNQPALEPVELLSSDELKKSYWAIKWVKSDDLVVSHRFIASDVKGNTFVWKFQTMLEDRLSLRLESQGSIPATSPMVATCIDVSHARGLIATGFSNGTVVVAQLSTLRPLYTFEGFGIQGIEQNSNSVRSIMFSPGGTLLAVANDSGSFGCVTLYETEFGERIGNLTVPTHSGQATTNVGTFAHNGWVFSMCFNPSGEFLVTCGYDSKLRVWDIKTRERVATLNITASDVENEDEMLLEDENGDSLKNPPIFDVKYFSKGVRSGMGNESNEGICCVCMDRSIRWFREAGGN